ncbi:hypothetical protein ACTXN4_03165 [Pseudomonas helleri]|uniref:hypothetical protein n=1 Tax=Pseudomonas helleri TaxID=1608996 RepID=UPI003FD2D6F2
MLGHLTPRYGEHSRLNECPVSLDHYTTDFLLGHSEESEVGELCDVVRELLIQTDNDLEEARAKDVVENVRIQYALASIKALSDKYAGAVQELEDAMERVEAANEWADMRGGLRLASAVEECCLKARQINHRLKGVARG